MTLSISFGSFKEVLPARSLVLEPLRFLGSWEGREERTPWIICQRHNNNRGHHCTYLVSGTLYTTADLILPQTFEEK